MQPDPDAITTFLSRLYDTDHKLERELAWSDPGQDAICHGERFAADDPTGFADRAAELNLAVPTVKTHYLRALSAVRSHLSKTAVPRGSNA